MTGPNTFVTDCSVPIWVTSDIPSMPIQARDTQLPRPSATGMTSGTFHSPVTQPNAWPRGACTTVPDQVGFVTVTSGCSRGCRSMPGTSSGTGVNSGVMYLSFRENTSSQRVARSGRTAGSGRCGRP